jgi:hypothetical protein
MYIKCDKSFQSKDNNTQKHSIFLKQLIYDE